ncbi:PLC-like phosphodiesterase [Durotheca rogersii]|uniref:PLC-like phosphodiesterase n=1 Tax=Durotheca rogersii TaxID=419775 RepID=UPI00221FC96F|nr:PLC-like phosphodiesterase [Durotheca rogersii]KAI5868311.1 PLC-like phosphodiesterase [Durotheca rogersii]
MARLASMADLVLRNLTATPLELTLVERFEEEEEEPSSCCPILNCNITSRIGGLFNSSSSTVNLRVQDDAKDPDAKDRREVSFAVAPFETRATDVRAAVPGQETVRLTFESGGHRYQVDVTGASQRSTVMTKLDGGPNEYTAIYVAAGSCLTVLSSANLSAWMRELHDEYPLSALSIPGTHNSPTYHVALPSVRCQAVNVREQLENGVRFFDIRVSVSPGSPDMPLVHSAFPVSLTGTRYFKDMLDVIYSFLEANPSEALVMSVKREGTGRGTDQDLSKILKDHFYEGARWYTEPRIPKVGEVRGKIVLLRRHVNDPSLDGEWGGRGWGLDGSVWPDNCADAMLGSGIARLQDFYEVEHPRNIPDKIELARSHLERAAEPVCPLPGSEGYRPDAPPPPFFFNFLSASNFFNANCWPEKIAAQANPAIVEYLCLRHGEHGKGPAGLQVGDASTGVVITDWVGLDGDWDVIKCIVGWNARLQLKQ